MKWMDSLLEKYLYVLSANECGAMNEWITIDQCFPPPHMCLHIIHNHISYLTQICWIENRTPGVGLMPSLVVSYGIPSGADTIHPALFHGSTCFISVTDFCDGFKRNHSWLAVYNLSSPIGARSLVVNWKWPEETAKKSGQLHTISL